jgi:hypothetical protein
MLSPSSVLLAFGDHALAVSKMYRAANSVFDEALMNESMSPLETVRAPS